MTQLTVRIEGDEKVRVGLNRFAQTIAPITRAAIKESMERALKRAIPYQGGSAYEVPERGYIRTGNLGRSGQVVVDGLSTRIQVEAYRDGKEYGGYVVGNAEGYGQATIHQGYWTTLRVAVDDEVEDLTRDIDAKLGESIEAAGL